MSVYKMSYHKVKGSHTRKITKLYEDFNLLQLDALEVLLRRAASPLSYGYTSQGPDNSIKKLVNRFLRTKREVNNQPIEDGYGVKDFKIFKHVDNEWVQLDYMLVYPEVRVYE